VASNPRHLGSVTAGQIAFSLPPSPFSQPEEKSSKQKRKILFTKQPLQATTDKAAERVLQFSSPV
jgi:hypothetical protein